MPDYEFYENGRGGKPLGEKPRVGPPVQLQGELRHGSLSDVRPSRQRQQLRLGQFIEKTEIVWGELNYGDSRSSTNSALQGLAAKSTKARVMGR